jgi:hypothetical protein
VCKCKSVTIYFNPYAGLDWLKYSCELTNKQEDWTFGGINYLVSSGIKQSKCEIQMNSNFQFLLIAFCKNRGTDVIKRIFLRINDK